MIQHLQTALPPDLAEMQREIEAYARRQGLDYYPVIFELVDADQLHAIAAYGGFPTRYPHWRFGMEYEQLCKGYTYGLQKIYELVINNDPCYAYLLRSNAPADQKMVMAHVYGHADFFKHNSWFAATDRKMMDHMASRGNRIRSYMDRYGVDVVETFLEACLTVEDLIDIHAQTAPRPLPPSVVPEEDDEVVPGSARFPAKPYLESFINPPAVLRAEAEARRAPERTVRCLPESPERDVLQFLLDHAPLRPWQADVLSTIRAEAYYFAPQAQTKILNEGWASFWHSTIMTRHGLSPQEVIHYCDHHSGTMASSPTRLNPYKLGLELLRDVEDRWNRGRHGPDYAQCEDLARKRAWDTHALAGRDKIFQVRQLHNDLTFIDEFLTLDFCREQHLFSFNFNADVAQYEIESREFPQIKERLLFQLTNRGRPIVRVADGNYKNRGELLLVHEFAGVELKTAEAQDTLANLARLWTRPVHLETRQDDKPLLLTSDVPAASEPAKSQIGFVTVTN